MSLPFLQSEKPILGKVQLLPLPGAVGWDGQWDALSSRAEQEATALATGGVAGLLVENHYDTPYTAERIDVAGAIALALLVKRIQKFTHLPVGLSVLQNDPQTALAVACNTNTGFIRLPLLSGALVTESGVIQSKLHDLLQYKNTLKTELPALLVDISVNHMVPERPDGEAAHSMEELNLDHLIHVARIFSRHALANAFIVSDVDLSPEGLEAFKQAVNVPVLIENYSQLPHTEQLDTLKAYYRVADGLILDAGIYKKTTLQPGVRPTVDMTAVEELVNHLRGIKPVTQMDPDVFLTR